MEAPNVSEKHGKQTRGVADMFADHYYSEIVL